MVAAQALEFRRPQNTSQELETLLDKYRLKVPKLEDDRLLSNDIHYTREFIKETILA
jgi:histidine ammonia-lyase